MKNNISSKEKEKRKELYQKMNGDRSNCDIKFSFPEKIVTLNATGKTIY